ncbi:iron chelate uptake ABC transporter family permease subunit [Streptomyces hebeiensis]|uniref:Iron chelate uptake ABC transporter family permease subunit n=1 Tax=Streptomyces hebeiensis TaxID=229486 RepID=A0ABN1V683_9ACTN
MTAGPVAGGAARGSACEPASGAASRPEPAAGNVRSVRGRSALALGVVVTVVLLVAAVWASLAVGPGDVSVRDVVAGLLDPDVSDKGRLIVREERVPRTVTGLLVGVALGLAGAVMQGVARNPLADPGILGVNAGASVAVVFGIGVLGLTAPTQYLWCGFLGALLSAILVYGIGSLGREGATPVKLALSGAAASAVLGSLTTALLLRDRVLFDRFRFWRVGSLSVPDPEVLWQALPFVAVGVVFALALGPRLNALSLGDDLARALGQRVGRARLAAAAAVMLLCGAATAVAGPIGFVGLVVPHAARLFTGPDYRWVLPYSALLAPVLVLVSDVVGRLLDQPGGVQVGIVTAVLGAVPFIVLVRRRRLVEL